MVGNLRIRPTWPIKKVTHASDPDHLGHLTHFQPCVAYLIKSMKVLISYIYPLTSCVTMIANYIRSYIYMYNIKVQVYCVELMLRVLYMH